MSNARLMLALVLVTASCGDSKKSETAPAKPNPAVDLWQEMAGSIASVELTYRSDAPECQPFTVSQTGFLGGQGVLLTEKIAETVDVEAIGGGVACPSGKLADVHVT